MFGLPIEAVVGMVSGLGGFIMKLQAQKIANQQEVLKMSLQKQEANNESADRASKRGTPFLRKFAAMTVLTVAFVGLFVVAFFPNVPVTIIYEAPIKSFLGLFDYGGGLEAVEVSGYAIPEWFKYSVISIIHFLFGTGAAKVAK